MLVEADREVFQPAAVNILYHPALQFNAGIQGAGHGQVVGPFCHNHIYTYPRSPSMLN
jgi:hypothetical protein